jgi:parvulin-like peptidyl-prolyl isomerase
MKKVLALILIFAALFTFTSCAQLNEEKAAKRVVATVNDTDITKADFDKYFKYYEVVYAVNGQSLPTGKDLTTFKEERLKYLAEVEAEYIDAVARGYKVSDSIYLTNVKNAMDYISQTVGADNVDDFYTENGTTKEAFEAFLDEYYQKLSYISVLENDFYSIMSSDESLYNYQVAKVNGNPFLMDKFLYYLMQESINSYITGEDTPSTDEEMQTYYKKVITNYAQLEAYYNYAVDNGITITNDEIAAKLIEVNLYINYMAPDTDSKVNFLKQQLISYDTWEKYSKENAIMLAAKEKAEDALKAQIADYTPTDKEIEKYYDENIAIVKGKYMYAKHILFSSDNEALAEECAQKAKDGEDFDTLMEEYQNADGVLEAADLGRFSKSDMVAEFLDAAFALSPGETSGVVKSSYGYHVIYAYEAPSLESEKTYITQTLIYDYQSTQLSKKEAKIIKTKVSASKTIKTAYDLYIDSLYDKYNIKLYESRVK